MSETIPLSPLDNLKIHLGPKLIAADHISHPEGVATGWAQLDHYLLWHGFPKGELSLLIREGGGATTLWAKSAALITQRGQWVAWVNEPETELTPWSLRHHHVELAKVLYVQSPRDCKQTLWALQELMALCLFEMIGCDLGALNLREHQILKLKKLAARSKTALVLLTSAAPQKVVKSSFYALVLQFHNEQVLIHRALHRPTPHLLDRKDLYADTLPQLAAGRRALCG